MNIDTERYVRPGLTRQDVHNIFLVFSNIQDENDAPDEVKLSNVQDLPFFESTQFKDQLDELAKRNLADANRIPTPVAAEV